MTAFARQEQQGEWGSLSWELRSVNHRFLELGFRLPEELRDLEAMLREQAGRLLQRGKLEGRLRFQPVPQAAQELIVNKEFAAHLARLSREVDGLLYNSAPVSSFEVLRWPGVLLTGEAQLDTVREQALRLFRAAVEQLVATRAAEGARLRALIEQRLNDIQGWVQKVRVRLPEALAQIRAKLLQRVAELKVEVDPQRFEQEVVLLALRMDVAEEIERLDAHAEETRSVLQQGGAVGRRLDFLMQEMHREANTLASKSADVETTRAAVDLKVLIEQIREQVQNIE
jgi:uncharacterized protein (TIGR00255 family)